MKKTLSVYFFAMAIILVGCSKQSDAPQTSATQSSTSTPSQTPQNELPKPQPKKKVAVDQIDFSKYPGVVKSGAFGYFFGLTLEQIQGAGIDIELLSEKGNLSTYKTDSAPLAWNDAENYLLIFYKQNLLKIVAVGKNITGDSTGSSGKAAFKELVTSLSEKYGKPKSSYHKVGIRLYQERDEFYQCLAYDGCGVWSDYFEATDRVVSIELKGGGRGSGFIKLVYESQPEWNQAVDQHQADLKEATKKGL